MIIYFKTFVAVYKCLEYLKIKGIFIILDALKTIKIKNCQLLRHGRKFSECFRI